MAHGGHGARGRASAWVHGSSVGAIAVEAIRWLRLQYISGMGANVRTLVSNTNATESTESKEGYAVAVAVARPPLHHTAQLRARVAPQCPPLTVAPIRSADDVAQ